jgi:hypothetical protein
MIRLRWLILLLMTSCGHAVDLPLEEDRLVEALIDTHLMEAALQPLSGTFKDSMRQVYFEQMLDIHDISEEEFRASVTLLAQDPQQMERIYRKVSADIKKKETTLNQ